jgi:hypothetical protein
MSTNEKEMAANESQCLKSLQSMKILKAVSLFRLFFGYRLNISACENDGYCGVSALAVG